MMEGEQTNFDFHEKLLEKIRERARQGNIKREDAIFTISVFRIKSDECKEVLKQMMDKGLLFEKNQRFVSLYNIEDG